MQTKQRDIFTTIQTEGALLPADLLRRIADGERGFPGLSEADYHLSGEKLNEAINRSWNRLQGAWAAFQAALEKITPNDPATTVTRERWLLPLFGELGYGRLVTARAIEIEGKSYAISHRWDRVPIHLVGARITLDRHTAGVAGAARTSPHSLVQELLNRSDDTLWAFVSNGLRLRILRDNTSLTRQAFVQFDLQAMMDGELYADFVLLWLLCHQSRVEAEKLEDFWLEKWSRTAQEQGTRALDTLRDGVQQAIEALGRGFLSHPANRPLREKLQAGALNEQDYYRQLLRLVYRLLFLFVAEDRELLLDPNADEAARSRYLAYYSTKRLRRLAERRRGTRHSDLYHGLRIVMNLLGRDEGGRELGLPALGSFLFTSGDSGAIADLEACEITNHDLLEAVRELAFTVDGTVLRPVDYRNMDAEELGSVYESLLELHPRLNVSAGTFALDTVSGSERKTTGSYYTPTSLITALLDSALNPVLDEAARQPNPAEAILDLKICDPACGSGHFLIAAAHRVARRLAAVETGDDEPAPEAVRSALRRVIGRCIYGVDLNPMAIELCKVSLWMEALDPGKALSFLDHHIQVGNSLLGTTPRLLKSGIPDEAFEPIEGDDKRICAEYKKRNKREREGQRRLFGYDLQPWEQLGNLATAMMSLDELDDSSAQAVRRKQQRYEELVHSQGYLNGRLLADTWCAAFVWKKTTEFSYPITEEVFRKIERNPFDVAPWMKDEIQRLAQQYQFFHWHIQFPDVFRVPSREERPENDQAWWRGGFDVVLGNPPWEHTELKEKEWFATRRPDIAEAKTGAERKRKIDALVKEDPSLYKAFVDARRFHDALSHFAGNSGRFPLCGRGRINTYAIFAETNRLILGSIGRVGCIVPSGIAADDTTKFFFQDLMDSSALVSLYDFENREGVFPGVHRSYKFCLLTLTGATRPATHGADFVFFALQTPDLYEEGRRFTLSAQDIALLNPNTRTCPIFRSKRDAALTKGIYRRVPVLIKEGTPAQNPWGITFRQGLFNMTSDSGLFCTREQLEVNGWRLEGNLFRMANESYLPLYEAKLIHHFDHRWATYDGLDTRDLTLAEKSNPECEVLPRYWVSDAEVRTQLAGRWSREWLIGFRNVCRSTDERTVIVSVFPKAAVGHSCPLIFSESVDALLMGCLAASMTSFAYDYCARQKLGGINLTFGYVSQFPTLPPATYTSRAKWFPSERLDHWFLPRLIELAYNAWDIEEFAKDCGYEGPPFRWNEERRFLLRCELDAAYFHLYGIARDDVDYIMETFPIVKRKDETAYGEYRTKRVILEIYDAMQRAIETGQSYQTLLDPPPADPRVAHSIKEGAFTPAGSRHPQEGTPIVAAEGLGRRELPPVPRPPASQAPASAGDGLERRPPVPQPARTQHSAPQQKPMPRPPVTQTTARAVVREELKSYKPEPTSSPPAPRPQPAAHSALPLKPKSEGNGSPQRALFDGGEGTSTPTGNAFHVGQNVRHKQFGPGQVIAVQGGGSEQLLTVRFKSGGIKKLMASMANLEKV